MDRTSLALVLTTAVPLTTSGVVVSSGLTLPNRGVHRCRNVVIRTDERGSGVV